MGLSSRAQLASLSTKAVSVLSAGWRRLHRPTPSRERRSCRAVPVAGVPYGLRVDIQWSLPSRGKRSLDSCQAGTETTLDLCKRHPAWFGPSALLNNHLLLGVISHSLAPSTSTPSLRAAGTHQPSPAPRATQSTRQQHPLHAEKGLLHYSTASPPAPSVLAYVMFFPYKFHLAALCIQTIQ